MMNRKMTTVPCARCETPVEWTDADNPLLASLTPLCPECNLDKLNELNDKLDADILSDMLEKEFG